MSQYVAQLLWLNALEDVDARSDEVTSQADTSVRINPAGAGGAW